MGIVNFENLFVLLAAIVGLLTSLFRYIEKRAGELLLPYLIWLFFAAYLNLGVAILN